MATIGVVGTTGWGTTLAIITARNGHTVRLHARSEEEAARLRLANENSQYLPGASFHPSMQITHDPTEALGGADLTILAVPSNTLRQNVKKVGEYIDNETVIVSAVKGLEIETGSRMSEVIRQEFDGSATTPICALSGPNLAREIIRGKLSSTVVASPDEDAAKKAQAILNSSVFRVYTNTDIIGVELGGALKNIIAIGAGICDGLQMGDNVKAAFMTRGLVEIARLGVASGARQMTMAGLAGMGDLIATCSSDLSRNHQVGILLSRDKTLTEIQSEMHNVAEGINTTAAARAMAAELGVEMPITEATYRVLFEGMSVDRAVAELMGRAPTPE
ncbi:MAG: NAD(P)-dependent glycerol-3-phosphate dehydrogenase [Chloroflexi bacterium]|nr:NAD(P)-dependent glycerol-3-phosphate dehydrogenase [Chloroflexota bacterium]